MVAINGNLEPNFSVNKITVFEVTTYPAWVLDDIKDRNVRYQLILKIIEETPQMTQEEMSLILHIPISTIKRDMEILNREGFLTREGAKIWHLGDSQTNQY